jgi:hypothetical protein
MRKCLRVGLVAAVAIMLLVLAPGANAQIPNAGFESWSGGNPDGWFTNNVTGYTFVSQSSAPHSETSALQGTVLSIFGFGSSPIIISGADGIGFPETTRPAALHGFYTLTSSGGDYLNITVALQKNGAGIGAGTVELAAKGTYTEFGANITYISADAPDTAIIEALVLSQGGTAHVGTVFTLDDLAWGAPVTDVPQHAATLPTEFHLGQNYPNPFNPSTVISYELPSINDVRLTVYDLVGREVATLVNATQAPGSYKVTFEGANLPTGLYLYRLSAGNFVQTRKMMIVK